jgi:hypothetical protein
MKGLLKLGVLVLALSALVAACTPTPGPPSEPTESAPAGGGACCAESGGVLLEFRDLRFAPGPLPPSFTFEGVTFTRIWDEIRCDGDSLWCMGGEHSGGVWYDATVQVIFAGLPCVVCKIETDVDGHGPDALLEGQMLSSATKSDLCPGDRRTLQVVTTTDDPFIGAMLSGQEAQWFTMRLE